MGVGEGGKSSSRWVVVGVGEGEFQPPGGGVGGRVPAAGGGGGRGKRSPTRGGEEIVDGEEIAGGRGAWERRTVDGDGDGDGEAPTCSKWVGFPRLFFPSWLRLLRFPQICKLFSFFGDL